MLIERLAELERTGAPKGAAECEDVHIDIYEYEAHIVGLAQSYLEGLTLDPALVLAGEDLSRKLDACESAVREMKAYKEMVSEIARLLRECLTEDG